MSRNYLHANNNYSIVLREQRTYDKLFEIGPSMNSLRHNFLKIEPEEYNSVEDLMIPLMSNSFLLQRLKNKQQIYEVKVFSRAGISGTAYDFEIYVGKRTKVKDDSLASLSKTNSTKPRKGGFPSESPKLSPSKKKME
ncbi:DDE_Tnp_1_7 domain-containing protein [Nephila pilipes]|uniref:DDE_Tnp_1_7 domain-containing protein n=1 Tax=Nephila pilipes TaxID=299642 RepID=A0A8X6N2V8_NEPPI|nr:DDE_Tnp_1_7 domain-containing protein [Nephila pilipes]